LAQGDILDRVGKALGDAVTGTGDQDQQRLDDAVSLCRDYAARLVRKAGGQSVSVERIRHVNLRGDQADVQADMRGRYDREESNARVDCQVDLSGHGRVTSFDDDGLVLADSRAGARSRSGEGGDAVAACSREARDQGYDVRGAEVSDEGNRNVTVQLQLRRQGNNVRTDCRYNKDAEKARLSRLGN